jgi:hypothetical protein
MVTDYNRQTLVQRPSRFVTEVPAELYEIWSLEEEHVIPAIHASHESLAESVGSNVDEAPQDDDDKESSSGGYVN